MSNAYFGRPPILVHLIPLIRSHNRLFFGKRAIQGEQDHERGCRFFMRMGES
jgi:hypothetical protein